MTVERRVSEPGSGEKSMVMTECPFCGQSLPDGKGFQDHYGECEHFG